MQDIRVQVESMPVDKSMGINNREDTYRLNGQAFLTCLLSSPISINISTTLAQPLAISLTKIKASATIAKAVPTRGAGAFVEFAISIKLCLPTGVCAMFHQRVSDL